MPPSPLFQCFGASGAFVFQAAQDPLPFGVYQSPPKHGPLFLLSMPDNDCITRQGRNDREDCFVNQRRMQRPVDDTVCQTSDVRDQGRRNGHIMGSSETAPRRRVDDDDDDRMNRGEVPETLMFESGSCARYRGKGFVRRPQLAPKPCV